MSIECRPPTRLVAHLAGLLAAAVLAVLAGCGGQDEDGTSPPPPPDAYAQAKSQWARSGSPSYCYLFARTCFCLPEESLLITVQAGRVSTGVYRPSGQVVPPTRLAELPTLDGLFAIADAACARGAARVEFRANASYGSSSDCSSTTARTSRTTKSAARRVTTSPCPDRSPGRFAAGFPAGLSTRSVGGSG
jgi:hypothetical protein